MQIAKVMNYLKYMGASKLLVAATFMFALIGLLGYSVIANNNPVSAKCSPNSIMECGYTDKNNFKAQYKANVTKDLVSLFEYFNLSPNEIDRFVSTAKLGTVYKDGRIVVDNEVVATGAWSLGRDRFNDYRVPITIGGHQYYWSYTTTAFSKNTNSIPAYVMFDDNGVVEFLALTECGNPVSGNKVTPKYSCDHLKKEVDESKKNTYKFHTEATAIDNAKIHHVEYDFGDGSPKVTRTNKSEVVTHTYTKPGKYQAKVTIYISLPGDKSKVIAPAGDCIKEIEVEAEKHPDLTCTSLTYTPLVGVRKYQFTVTVEPKDGAVFKHANFDFGDGQKAENLGPTAVNQVVTTHEFAEADKEYTIGADVYFNVGQDLKSKHCEVKIKTPPKTCDTNPELPQCKPCVINPNLPECTPKVIAKTGPAEFIGGAVGFGSIAGAGYYYLGSRRNLINNLLKR